MYKLLLILALALSGCQITTNNHVREPVKVVKKSMHGFGSQTFSVVLTENRGVCLVPKAYDYILIEEGKTYMVDIYNTEYNGCLDGIKYTLYDFKEER